MLQNLSRPSTNTNPVGGFVPLSRFDGVAAAYQIQLLILLIVARVRTGLTPTDSRFSAALDF